MRALNLGLRQPEPQFDVDDLQSFYWQFARSRIDSLDIMRFGREFITFKADNVRVLLNATATQIGLTSDNRSFDNVDISTLDGAQSYVKAKVAVVAASGIENPRILLASASGQGIGNAHDTVGRFLMDHPGARVGHFERNEIPNIVQAFGFFGVRDPDRTHMFMHGLAPNHTLQAREELPNCAVYFMPERAPDDPWNALKRLFRSNSTHPFQDVRSLLSGAKLLATGASIKVLASARTPRAVKDLLVNLAIRHNPNFVAQEFQSRGVPHKLTGVAMDVITEQRPNPASRVRLSDRVDRLGVPVAAVEWRITDEDQRAIVRIGQLARDALVKAGLPKPVLEPWLVEGRVDEALIIDMAHTLGTTRMSVDPKTGVVDRHCQVHGVDGLYVAGGSVFPTSGHANPTLMILALAIRLSDVIKARL